MNSDKSGLAARGATQLMISRISVPDIKNSSGLTRRGSHTVHHLPATVDTVRGDISTVARARSSCEIG